MKTFFRFFISRALWLNLLVMAVLTAGILWFTFNYLKDYTHHGEEFSLPDFNGLTLAEVQGLCQEKHLRYEIMDSVFNRRKKRGTVVEQDPPPNFKVKENRRVFLIMNSTQPEMIKMPMVKNVDFKQAWMDLEAHGLSISKITYEDDPAKHLVLEQKYDGQVVFQGEKIEKGAEIELVLGAGEDPEEMKVKVPLLLGMSENAVKRKLLKSYLNLGVAVYDRSVETYEDTLKAFVWKHRPNSSRFHRVKFGTAVNVWLTLDSTKIEADSTNVAVADSLIEINYNVEASDSLMQELDSVY